MKTTSNAKKNFAEAEHSCLHYKTRVLTSDKGVHGIGVEFGEIYHADSTKEDSCLRKANGFQNYEPRERSHDFPHILLAP